MWWGFCILTVFSLNLQHSFKALVIKAERIELGEHVGYGYVKEVLKVAIDQWNHCIDHIRDHVSKPEVMLREVENQARDVKSEKEVVSIVKDVESIRTNPIFRKIILKETDGAFMKLDYYFVLLLFLQCLFSSMVALS